MSLLEMLDPILEFWLPTKWSRWSVMATLLLAASSCSLSEFLPLIGYNLMEEYKLTILILLPTLICLIGSFVVLSLVVRHSKLLTKQIEDLKLELINQNEAHMNSLKENEYLHLGFYQSE